MSDVLAGALSGTEPPEPMRVALGSIRRHLGMEVAYISEFVDGRSVFREVDAPGLEDMIKVGDSRSLEDVYCQHILEGRLPELMADTADHPLAMAMPITRLAPIGAHVSVPIRLADGNAFGMLCCLSPTPNPSLNERDLNMLRIIADMAAGELIARKEGERLREEKIARIRQVIEEGAFTLLLQPIWEFGADMPVGFEALTRFKAQPYRPPNIWFNEAAEVGYGVQLEVAALLEALKLLERLPEHVYLSINASPATILGGDLDTLLARYPLHRIVLEVTEHARIDDYAAIAQIVHPLRSRGLRMAVDDAGAGYASFQHILRLAPDIIKLDMGLTRAVDVDVSRRSLVSAMTVFARETGTVIVAEGIETQAEWQALRLIGITRGQGYLLGRPGDLASAESMLAGAAIASHCVLPG